MDVDICLKPPFPLLACMISLMCIVKSEILVDAAEDEAKHVPVKGFVYLHNNVGGHVEASI